MKRILPLILLLVCGFTSLNAQIRVFKDAALTQEIKDGDRITFITAEEDPFGQGNKMGDEFGPYFVPSDLSSPTNYEVSITLMATNDAEYKAEWCGLDGSCVPIEGTSMTKTGVTKGTVVDGAYQPGMGDDMELHLYFTPGTKNNVTVKVDVTCDGDPVLTFYEMFYYDDTEADESPIKVINMDGSEVTDGQTITLTPEADPLNPENSMVAASLYPAYVASTVGENVNYTVSLTYTSQSEGAYLSWCMGGSCSPVPEGGMSKSATTATTESNGKVVPGFTDLMNLEIYFTKGNYGKVNCTVDVRAEGKVVLTYYIVGDYNETSGISQASSQSSNISLSSGNLNYSFADAAQRTVNLYAADGRLVKQAAVNGAQGNISLNGLNRGVYVWTVIESGRTLQSGKALVR